MAIARGHCKDAGLHAGGAGGIGGTGGNGGAGGAGGAGQGGGIYNGGTLNIVGGNVSGNRAAGGTGGDRRQTAAPAAPAAPAGRGGDWADCWDALGPASGWRLAATGARPAAAGPAAPRGHGEGGGIYNAGALTMSGVTVQDNTQNTGGSGETAGGSRARLAHGGAGGAGGQWSSPTAGDCHPTPPKVRTALAGAAGSDGATTGAAPANGGGIYNASGLTMTGSTVASNSAKNDGGGIYSKGALTINTSTLSDNTADSDSSGIGDGGAIFQYGSSLSIQQSSINTNTARTGGAVRILNGAVATVRNSTFSGNTAALPRRRVQRRGCRKPAETQPEHRSE